MSDVARALDGIGASLNGQAVENFVKPAIVNYNDTIKHPSHLRRLMEEKNITPYMLAKHVGVSSAAVINWRNGKNLPTTRKLANMVASYLGGEGINDVFPGAAKHYNKKKDGQRVRGKLLSENKRAKAEKPSGKTELLSQDASIDRIMTETKKKIADLTGTKLDEIQLSVSFNVTRSY